MAFRIEYRLPTHTEYRQLCESVGWGQIINFDASKSALDNSIVGVVATAENGHVIGMGRIVGDGAIYFYIQDIVVMPDYQKQGIGSSILSSLLEYIRDNGPAKSFIGLFSVPEAIEFYKRFTLEKRDLVGLFTVMEIIGSRALESEDFDR
jgi:ribosomal protein S18 acetylase RimI-like enzyme